MLLAGVLAAIVGGVLPAGAAAEPRSVLDSFGTPNGIQGGQLVFAKGVAVNQSGVGAPAGSVYVAEANNNHRVSQFDKDGNFIRTWGYDVIDGVNFPGAPNQNGTGFEICDVTNGNTAAQCKNGVGVTGPAAGQFANPQGLTIDQSTGYLYVTSNGNRRVDIFTGAGSFVGAFGYDVLPGDPNPSGPDFCTTATGCQAAAAAGANAGRFANLQGAIPAIDPNVPGRVYIPDQGNLRVNQYTVTITAGVLTGVSFDKAFGWDVIPANATTTLESCTILTTCQAGTSGSGAGQFASGGSPNSVAVDGGGSIYVTSGPLSTGICSPATPCRVQKFAPDASSATDFGPSSGEGQLTFASGNANAVAALNLAVDPSNAHVFVLRKESGTTYRVLEYDSAGAYQGANPSNGVLTTSGVNNTTTVSTGLAVGTAGRLYVNYGASNAGEVHILGPIPAPPPPVISPITDITSTSAKFQGEVSVPSPGGNGFETSWRFEYSTDGSDWSSTPVPDGSLGNVAGTYTVQRVAQGLEPNTKYFVRLAATTSLTSRSDVEEFTTSTEKPVLDSVFSESASPTEMVLGAEIDANSLPTTYHIEWGTEAGVYPNRVPAIERDIGSGSSAIAVQETIGGLTPETSYHFRVIAQNAAGTTVGEDQELLTLNASGLPADRGIELVSPAYKRPVGNVENFLSGERVFQAAEEGSGMVFPIFNGLEESTAGGMTIYRGARSDAGWKSSQVTPPALTLSPQTGSNNDAKAGNVKYFSPDLGCAVLMSHNPLTADTPAVDATNGVHNLYRWNAVDGSYTLITKKPPLNPLAGGALQRFEIAGASADCSRIIFRSLVYQYIPGATSIYEWDSGVLRDAALRPDGSTPSGLGGGLGGLAAQIPQDRYTVAPDGRLFFPATSNEPLDNGKMAVFVRKSPTEVVNASKPTSGNPTLGAKYEGAAPDGSHVFFRANYGLTAAASNGPVENCAFSASETAVPTCTLYDYDVGAGTLTDIAATTDPDNPKGAMAQGVVDVSQDGSVIYFAAQGQLVPDKGRTYAENVSGAKFANIYRYHEGQTSFVGTIDNATLRTGALLGVFDRQGGWTAQTTRDGEYLLFPSADDFTGNNPNKVRQAYLYSAETGATVCVSCPSRHVPTEQGEIVSQGATMPPQFTGNYSPRALSEDGRVFFQSADALTPNAEEQIGPIRENEGETNVYEWYRGQVSLLAEGRLRMADSNADGTDVYIRTYEQLVPEDEDFAPDIYDFKIGSPGFPAQPPKVLCDPAADQCQGTPTSAPGAPGTASSGFNGPGNPAPEKPKKPKCGKGKVLKHGKCVKKHAKKKKKQKGKGQSKRAASTNRGGAK